jgi:hypothetical protein
MSMTLRRLISLAMAAQIPFDSPGTSEIFFCLHHHSFQCRVFEDRVHGLPP